MDGDTQQPSITCDGSQRSCWYHRTLHTHSLPTGQSLAEADVRSYASIFHTWKNNPMHEARKLSHSPAYKYSFNILISNCEEINFKKSHIWPSNTWTAWGLKVFLLAFKTHLTPGCQVNHFLSLEKKPPSSFSCCCCWSRSSVEVFDLGPEVLLPPPAWKWD